MNGRHNNPQNDALRLRQKNAAGDAWIRAFLHVEPTEDRSGLFATEPSPTTSESDDEAQFQANVSLHATSTALNRKLTRS